MSEPICRCGWDGTGDHLCHRCGVRPGTRRFQAYVTALAGAQMKFGARETHGCDQCWAEFQSLTARARGEQEER